MQYGHFASRLRDRKASEEEKKLVAVYLRMIDEAVFESGAEIAPYLLEAVTHEDVSFHTLQARGIPCSKNYFYNCRRKFFVVLDKKRGTQETSS